MKINWSGREYKVYHILHRDIEQYEPDVDNTYFLIFAPFKEDKSPEWLWIPAIETRPAE